MGNLGVGWLVLAVTLLTVGMIAPLGSAQVAASDALVAPHALTPPASIQAAIDHAASGARILVGPGTFIEQLVIDRSVTLVGAGIGQTVLQSPAVLTPDSLGANHVITLGHHAEVTIKGFTIESSLQCGAAPYWDGGAIGVGGSAQLILKDSLVTTRGSTTNVGAACTVAGVAGLEIVGNGVDVGFNSPPLANGTPAWKLHGHAILDHDVLFGFGDASNGPAVFVGDSSGAGSSATLADDTVLAPSVSLPFFLPDSYHAEVMVTGGATASVVRTSILGGAGTFYGVALNSAGPSTITHDAVGNMTCEGFPPALQGGFCGPDIFTKLQYAGILVIAGAPGTVIDHNLIFATDSGIYLLFSTGCCEIRSNTILDSIQYAFEIQDTVAFLSHNLIVNAAYEVGVGADALNSSATLRETPATGISVGDAFTEAATGLTATATFLDPD
jgi:hypothetical protein